MHSTFDVRPPRIGLRGKDATPALLTPMTRAWRTRLCRAAEAIAGAVRYGVRRQGRGAHWRRGLLLRLDLNHRPAARIAARSRGSAYLLGSRSGLGLRPRRRVWRRAYRSAGQGREQRLRG